MDIEISRAFKKDADVFPKRTKQLILKLIQEIEEIQKKEFKTPFDLKDCEKLKGRENLYRIRKGSYRLTFEFKDGKAYLKRVLIQGQVYKKHNL